ncbi:MAG: hypothetical protein P8Z79_05430 [Sedimentisphaerales bacterium]|jgi:hypothetical protein
MVNRTSIPTLALLMALLGPLLVWGARDCRGKSYPYRWVYVSRSLHRDSDVADIRNIAEIASESGLNGMVLSAGLDRLDQQSPDYFARLEQVKEICRQNNVEIIPIVFSIGYGGAILAQNKNLAAGIPVKKALFVVDGDTAHFVPDSPAEIVNPGFEQYEGDRLTGYRLQDRPGEVSFVDRQVRHSGGASLRFEHFGDYQYGHARLMQELEVCPNRCYRVNCWVKTDSLEPSGAFRMMVLTADGRDLAPWNPNVPSTTDWREVVMGFNSLQYNKVRIYMGAWGGKSGRFWVDDLSVEEVGLLNVLRRPGTPVKVQSAETGRAYVEGKDFAEILDRRLNFRFDHESPAIEILPGSAIKGKEALRVSYYHGMAINGGQVTACMSEPEVYEIWTRQARLMHEHLAPNKYLLSMDEIRAGGSCRACKERNMSMAQILGDCVTQQTRILHEVNPHAELFIWSDMFDPNHNAHGDYYLVDGDFTGSWNYIPKDLVIVCWYYNKRVESLNFFSSRGFKTLAGAYYDGDTLENPRGWLEILNDTPGACGIMYTTWRNKYELLAPFGNLVTGGN